MSCDTGSGDIVGEALKLGSNLNADTGSGDVTLSGDFSAVARIAIEIEAPRDFSRACVSHR